MALLHQLVPHGKPIIRHPEPVTKPATNRPKGQAQGVRHDNADDNTAVITPKEPKTGYERLKAHRARKKAGA